MNWQLRVTIGLMLVSGATAYCVDTASSQSSPAPVRANCAAGSAMQHEGSTMSGSSGNAMSSSAMSGNAMSGNAMSGSAMQHEGSAMSGNAMSGSAMQHEGSAMSSSSGNGSSMAQSSGTHGQADCATKSQ